MSRTVEDAGPYKEKSNFLMRTCLFREVFFRRGPREAVRLLGVILTDKVI